MYRADIEFESTDKNVLSFKSGEVFNLIEQIDKHWWLMQDEYGNHGLVPASYLEVNNVWANDVLNSIKRSIDAVVRLAKQQERTVNDTERRNLRKLSENYNSICEGDSLWKKNSNEAIPIQPKRQAPKAPGKRRSTKRYSAPPPPSGDRNSSESPSSTLPTGATSKVYNIQVSHGDVTPIYLTHDSVRLEQQRSFKKEKKHAEKQTQTSSYLISVIKDSKNIDSNSSKIPLEGGTTLTITESDINNRRAFNSITKKVESEKDIGDLKTLQGENFTITKSETNPKHKITPTQSFGNNSSSNSLKSLQVDIRRTADSLETTDSSTTGSSMSKDSFVSNKNGSAESVSTVDTDSRTLVPSLPSIGGSYIRGSYIGGINVADAFGKQLVDDVRERCNISFNKALAAVRCVIQNLGHEVPEISDVTSTVENQIQDDRLHVYKGTLAAEDSHKFTNILDQLTSHKEDSQQRNWAVHEDFQTIKDLLDQVVVIMDEIDPSICREVLRTDEYRYINNIILYYQMEHRSKLRIALLHVFGCCCQLGEDFVSTLLCSVLPTELAQDMMQDQSDSMKFLSSALMLTMLFSTGEPVPYQHYVQFNDDFIHFVLNLIEDPPDNDTDDQASDCLIGMLLSFNQHFKAPQSSTLIQVLKTRKVFRTLTEKILLLLNREIDPCALFEFVNSCPDSVLKFFIDIFSAKETSGIFFTNDLNVLYDIILRQLVNREEKDKVRTEYLSLFHSILNTTDYREHQRHVNDFQRRFAEILRNEENESEVDIYIVREIVAAFGDLFDENNAKGRSK